MRLHSPTFAATEYASISITRGKRYCKDVAVVGYLPRDSAVRAFRAVGMAVILRGVMVEMRRDEGMVSVLRLEGGPTVASAVLAAAGEPGGFALESTAPEHPQGRYTILGFDPIDVYELDAAANGLWLDDLRRRVGASDARYRNPTLPFVGGWVGFASYEAGSAIESVRRTTPRDLALAAVRFALYDTVAIFDHHRGRWLIVAVELPGHRRAMRLRRLRSMQKWLGSVEPVTPVDWSQPAGGKPKPAMSHEDYLRRVRTAKAYIEAGDIYQVNLTQRFTARAYVPAIEIYRRLRVANPAPFSAFLSCGETAILSASPELFLHLRGRQVLTRPIKGTRPRVGDDVLDAVRGRELMTSEKDRAELTMIVDLLRNDLGRVSDYGTVRVLSDGDLEEHPTVFHRVASITSRLREGAEWADLLRSGFPGGSITGCPKIRAMQIIDELEPTERSVYCGSIGYIGLDGSLCLSIAIRTIVYDRGNVHLFGGGAIVADSDAEDEYQESLAKMAGMIRALSIQSPGPAVPMMAAQTTV